ncbi:MAG: hypothetical protein JXO72_03055 [Vicinamibacteria bacterium]|nr:hypothetical protein [Vicinamibacteria bacterium]
MDSLFLLAVGVLTSIVVFGGCARRRGWSRSDLRRATGSVFETVGLILSFYALNVSIGLGLALLVRSTGVAFISLYVNADLSLFAFALIQGLAFEFLWRRSGVREKRVGDAEAEGH